MVDSCCWVDEEKHPQPGVKVDGRRMMARDQGASVRQISKVQESVRLNSLDNDIRISKEARQSEGFS